MDIEDINFLEDLAEELRRIDPEAYEAEAVELENIIYRERLENSNLTEDEKALVQIGRE